MPCPPARYVAGRNQDGVETNGRKRASRDTTARALAVGEKSAPVAWFGLGAHAAGKLESAMKLPLSDPSGLISLAAGVFRNPRPRFQDRPFSLHRWHDRGLFSW